MRVLCITSHGNTLNSIRPEAEAMIGLRRAGVELDVMTQGDSAYAERFREEGIGLIDFVPRRKISLSAIRFIRRTLVEGRYDIVHLYNNKAIANGLLAAIGLPVKALTYRGQTGNLHRYDPFGYLTHLSPRVDGITCVARAVQRDLQALRPRHPHIVTVYKGHDLAWYGETPADLGALGVRPGSVSIICVANNRPRKGVPVLVEAFARLPADVEADLLLVGKNMDTPELQQEIAAHPRKDRIHVVGFRTDAPRLTAGSDIAVLPAIKREGLPKTVIEAMAYGVPVVVSDTGGNAELVEDGVSGRVVPPGDADALAAALAGLARDPAQRRAMGEAARVRIGREFTVQATVEATLKLYREVLGEDR